jgi:methyl-accepting chemotaxis protein
MTQIVTGKHIFPTSESFYKKQTSSSGSGRLKILLVPLTLTIALCAGMGWYVWDFYKAFKNVQTQDLRIQDLSNQITYIDEVLTSSVRLAATTGDKRSEERYLSFVPKLDDAVSEAQQLLPNVFKTEAFTKTEAANTKLVEMEKQAFDLVHQGRQKAATDLLLSSDYENQKEIYTEGLSETTTALKKYVEANIQAKSQQAFSVTVMIGVALIILLFSWIAVLRMMKQYIQAINDTGMAISTSSTEIAATIEQQERAAAMQAASVNQTTTTMDELGASSRTSAEQAEAAARGAAQVLALVDGASHNSDAFAQSSLRVKVGEITDQILRLSEQTQQIGSISTVVSELANQTNMLALNAAVEAVRAGDRGKGFTVVATEIRKLAEQSKKAASRINALVMDIQKATNSTVMVTDEGRKTVDTVVAAVSNISTNVQQISLTANQQAVAIGQVVDSMNSINSGVAQTASGLTQTKVATQNLNQAATKLSAVV